MNDEWLVSWLVVQETQYHQRGQSHNVYLILDILLLDGPHAVPVLVIIASPNLQDIVIPARYQDGCDDIPLDIPDRALRI